MAILMRYCDVDEQYMLVDITDEEYDKLEKAGKITVIDEGMPFEFKEEHMPDVYKTKVMKPEKKAPAKKKATTD